MAASCDLNRQSLAPEALAEQRARWSRWLVIPIYVGCLLAFLTDIFVEVFMLFGLFYLPLIVTAMFHRDPRWALRLAWIASAGSAIGFFFPIINPDTTIAIINRTLSIVALFTTAALVRHARMIQDRLAEQTVRAEAAERLKTEIFTTLSTELRQPLHGLAALSSVMMADCRPDQRAPLGQVQHNSQRLSATIDNLIDLIQLDEQQMRRETVDVDAVLTQAVAAARPLAESRQVTVVIDHETAEQHLAHGDPWAIRRIVDNILTNAVKFSPPSSVVEIGAETSRKGTTIVIRDTGNGIPPTVLDRLVEPQQRAEPTLLRYAAGLGAGLTLCRGLAAAMGAELSFDSEIGSGTTVTLLLPA